MKEPKSSGGYLFVNNRNGSGKILDIRDLDSRNKPSKNKNIVENKETFIDSDLSGGYDKSIDAFAYLNRLNGFTKVVKESFPISVKSGKSIENALKKKGVKILYKFIDHGSSDEENECKYIDVSNKILICAYFDDFVIKMIYEEENEKVIELRKYFLTLNTKDKTGKISFLTHSANGGFGLVEVPNKSIKIDLEANYEVNYDLKKLISKIEEDRAGLILLASHTPGTGKSYLIKYLSNVIDKRFVFMPNNVISNVSNPDFMGFALHRLKNTILIAEDAELCLIDRQKMQGDAVSTLLNITDGIVGDALNLKVIATLNNEELIDRALLRKGRLIAKVDFKELPVEKANKFLENRKISKRVNVPTSLADLYNIEDEGVDIKQKRQIGFKTE